MTHALNSAQEAPPPLAAPSTQPNEARARQLAKILAKARPSVQRLSAYASARLNASAAELQSSTLLNANENPYPPPGALPSRPARSWDTNGYNYYPEPQPQALVAALAALYRVQAAQVLVGRGSDEVIDLLIRAFCGEQDAIAICSPTFGMYGCYAQIQGCRVLDVPLVMTELRPLQQGAQPTCSASAPNSTRPSAANVPEQGQADHLAARYIAQIPLAALRQTIATQAPKLLFLPSPLAPLGAAILGEQLREVLELCARYDVLFVVDEAYAEFAHLLEPSYRSCVPWLAECPNLAILRTLSKAYSLAGERIGCLLAAPQLVALLRKLQAPYPLPGSISRYVCYLLQDQTARDSMAAHLAQLCAQHSPLVALLERQPYIQKVYSSAANFIMAAAQNTATAAALLQHCRQRGLVLRDFNAHLAGHLRISLGTAEQMATLHRTLTEFAKLYYSSHSAT